MDVLDNLVCEADAALLIVSFLQADHKSADYRDELVSLGQEVGRTRAVDVNGCTDASADIECLEADGSGASCVTFYPLGAQSAEPLQRLGELCVCTNMKSLRCFQVRSVI